MATLKINSREHIKAMLEVNDAWLMRGIVAIWQRQTNQERRIERTLENNGVGFNGCDAEFLSSLACQIQERGSLSPRQIDWARKKMIKYAGQLAKIAAGLI